MNTLLPSKAQPKDEVTFEIGTTEVIRGKVRAVTFYDDGDITYDLVIATSPGGQPISEIKDVHSSLVSVIAAKPSQE